MSERILKFSYTGEPYSGFVAACKWLKKNGYSWGIMQGTKPIGIMEGKFVIDKWSTMGFIAKARMHGWIEFPYGNPRTNSVLVRLR